MLSELKKYAEGLGANQEVSQWVNTTLAKTLKKRSVAQGDAEHIIDYLMSPSAPKRLQRMSYVQALIASAKWSQASQKKGRNLTDSSEDIETIHDFLNGTRIVKLKTKSALQREGFLMSHCVGGYNPESKETEIYSYRDEKNIPHATFEVKRNAKEITQIKGKGNGAIHPKYVYPILAFLNTLGIQVRPNDMKNLGYHHLKSPLDSFIENLKGAKEKIQVILGEKYIYARD